MGKLGGAGYPGGLLLLLVRAILLGTVNWAMVAGRSAVSADPDWGDVLSRGGPLPALAVVAVWLSTRTFRSYQKSV